jgi:hypothetical protein
MHQRHVREVRSAPGFVLPGISIGRFGTRAVRGGDQELLGNALDGLQRTRTEATIPYQAAVLIGALDPASPDLDRDGLLAVLEQLTAADLKVLRIIWKANEEYRRIPREVLAIGMGTPAMYGSEPPPLEHWDLHVQRLEALGPITICGDRETRQSHRGYEVTSAFDALLRIVGEVDGSSVD